MGVQPNDGEFFVADDPVGLFFYGRCIETGSKYVTAKIYSRLCPDGESGSYPVANIFKVITEEEFEAARSSDWPN